MKAFKKILISLLVIAVLLVVVSFFLPGHVTVKRTAEIKAPMDQIVAQVNKFENWEKWSPWAEKDSTIVNTYEGSVDSDMYKMSWTSEESGDGSMTREEILNEGASTKINYKLAFTKPNEMESKNSFLFEKAEEGVKVTWSNEVELGNNPIMKYMGLFMDGMIGPDFEKGLQNLKEYMEDPANQKSEEPAKMTVNGFDAELINIEEFSVIGIRKQMTIKEIQDSAVYAENYAKMGAYCEANGIIPAGPPAAIYYDYNEEKDFVDVLFAFPVATETAAPEKGSEIQVVKVPANQVLSITHIGPYDQIGTTWEAIDVWLQDMGMQYAGAPWESYVSDPSKTPAAELITKIVVPVAEMAKTDLEGDTGE